jgi:hypothetical protein
MMDILLDADFQKSCKPVKRIAIGAKVTVDATGTGDWVVGEVFLYDAKLKKVTICEINTGELVVVIQPQLLRVTDYWWNQIRVKDQEEDYEEEEEDYEDGDDYPESLEDEDAEDEDAEAEEEAEGGSVVKEKYKARYKKTVTSQGRVSLHNGDPVSQELAGMSVEDTYQHIATQTKSEAAVSDLSIRWSHLNKGQQRMLLGNWYRNWLRDFGDDTLMDKLVEQVKEYIAKPEHYNAGWDVILECYTDHDIKDEIQGATTLRGAIRKLKPLVDSHAAASIEVLSTVF